MADFPTANSGPYLRVNRPQCGANESRIRRRTARAVPPTNRARICRVLVGFALSVGLAVAAPVSRPALAAGAGVITAYPSDDAYVHSGSPDANFGSSSVLRTDASPDIRSYLLFDVQGLSGPAQSATLRLHVLNSSGYGIEVHGVGETGWSEATITYANAPAVGAVVGSSGPYPNSAWVEVDVTSLVTGNGLVSVAVTTTSPTNTKFNSEETAASMVRPQLVIDPG